MSVTETDIQEVQAKINPLLGKKAWGVSLGVGSFITMEFGKPLPASEKQRKIYGEWHLWIYCCAWRLEAGEEVLVASEDERTEIEVAIQCLEGLKLCAIQLLRPAWDTVFTFENQVVLYLFSIHSQEYEHWLLYTPEQMVISIGPGTDWSYESMYS